jgi:hypothetical protein
MRKLLLVSGLLLLSAIEFGSLSAISNPKATIKWEKLSYDFGEIPYNKPIQVNFSFKNPGMIPLIISDVKTSCGCTVADFPKQPITSGASGTISVTFDAKSPGYQSKTVTVYSNSQEGMTELYIKGVVVK